MRQSVEMRRSQARCLVGLVVSLLCVAGATGGMRAEAVDATPLAQIQTLLDQRAAAVRAGDRTAWMATVDPQASAARKEAQARRFDGLRSLPLASYALRARTDDTGDLGAGLSSRYGGAPVFLPETRQLYRFRDFDDRDALDTMWWTYVRRGDRWYVGGEDDLTELGLDTAHEIWDLGAVRVRPTDHFLVISHPAQAERADALARTAEEALAVLAGRWDQPWSGRIPLILPGSVQELETILQATFDLDNFVAFVVFNSQRDDTWAATAPRIYIQDRNLGRYPHGFQVRTLVHELTHAAAVPLAGPAIPNWVHEGVADWIAEGRARGGRAPKGSDGVLPRDDEFSTGSTASIVRAYDESRSAVAVLAGISGLGAPSALLRQAGEDKLPLGSPRYHTDRALRSVAGLGWDDLERRWARGVAAASH